MPQFATHISFANAREEKVHQIKRLISSFATPQATLPSLPPSTHLPWRVPLDGVRHLLVNDQMAFLTDSTPARLITTRREAIRTSVGVSLVWPAACICGEVEARNLYCPN